MTQPTPGHAEVSRFQEAYDKLHDEIQGVAPSDYAMINIDIPSAITTVLGALSGIQALRPRVVVELSTFDIARFDKLEAYTLALGHAHAGYMAASQPVESLDALSEEGSTLRDVLVSDANALALRMLLDPERLKQLKGIKGYRNLAFDLLALARLFRDDWASIQGKCAVQMSELQHAELLADRLLMAVGHREQAPAAVVEAADIRQRAFTLFLTAYEHVQRAVRFLRSEEGDWDDVAPSIYAASRSNARKKASSDEQPIPPQAMVSPAGIQAPSAVKSSSNGPQSTFSSSVGLPNSDPFVRG